VVVRRAVVQPVPQALETFRTLGHDEVTLERVDVVETRFQAGARARWSVLPPGLQSA
jgi:hypothetical protein